MSSAAAKSPHAGCRFPRVLGMVEEMLAARGIIVSHEIVRQWARKFGQDFVNRLRRGRPPRAGAKWRLNEVAIEIAGVTRWPWRAIDGAGVAHGGRSGARPPALSGRAWPRRPN